HDRQAIGVCISSTKGATPQGRTPSRFVRHSSSDPSQIDTAGLGCTERVTFCSAIVMACTGADRSGEFEGRTSEGRTASLPVRPSPFLAAFGSKIISLRD